MPSAEMAWLLTDCFESGTATMYFDLPLERILRSHGLDDISLQTEWIGGEWLGGRTCDREFDSRLFHYQVA